uniref:Uncharacterized protein n=1 Tax=Callithrix jacchus TaxID=9483 RepID=A0A8I3X325_CALJA|nr:ankyrin repeat domain-containing protein 11-like [Callithrix jacchus]
MPKGGCPKVPQQESLSLYSDMLEKWTGKKDKVSLTKTPKLESGDGRKEVRERASKRNLPFTVGANGEQKDSDTGPLGSCLSWGSHEEPSSGAPWAEAACPSTRGCFFGTRGTVMIFLLCFGL